jgi:two-component system LytT family sensor kinase
MTRSRPFRDTLLRISMAFLAATVIGVIFAGQIRFSSLARGHVVGWGQSFYWALGDWYEWLILSPFILALARRFRFEPGSRVSSTLIHFATSVIFATIHAAMCALAAIAQAWVQHGDVDFVREFQLLMSARFPLNLVVCAVFVAGWNAWNYSRESQERAAQAAKLASDLAEARLNALRMQLNPHFLFNTLNSISALMLTDINAANRMISLLGAFLRRSLESENSPEIPLRRELAFAREYLEIEALRFGDKLAVRFTTDENALDAAVPHLILQPLVENAVYHGVERSLGPSEISVSATRNNGHLELCIRNSASGFPGEKSASARNGNGIGLANTRARLLEIYGQNHRFEFEHASNGAVVKLTVPYRGLERRGPDSDAIQRSLS